MKTLKRMVVDTLPDDMNFLCIPLSCKRHLTNAVEANDKPAIDADFQDKEFRRVGTDQRFAVSIPGITVTP